MVAQASQGGCLWWGPHSLRLLLLPGCDFSLCDLADTDDSCRPQEGHSFCSGAGPYAPDLQVGTVVESILQVGKLRLRDVPGQDSCGEERIKNHLCLLHALRSSNRWEVPGPCLPAPPLGLGTGDGGAGEESRRRARSGSGGVCKSQSSEHPGRGDHPHIARGRGPLCPPSAHVEPLSPSRAPGNGTAFKDGAADRAIPVKESLGF